MQERSYVGRMVVETAILFPLLFLLWMCMLYHLFRLGSQTVGETVSGRCVMICQELGIDQRSQWQKTVEKVAREYIEKSGMPIALKQVSVDVEEGVLFDRITIEMILEYSVWKTEEWTFTKSGYEMQNISLRNLMDFLWETGEELPVIGPMIQEYKAQLEQIKGKLGET